MGAAITFVSNPLSYLITTISFMIILSVNGIIIIIIWSESFIVFFFYSKKGQNLCIGFDFYITDVHELMGISYVEVRVRRLQCKMAAPIPASLH